MSDQPIFLDGEIVKARGELLESLAPGNVRGKGVFETMCVVDGVIFAVDDHLRRLKRGLRRLNIPAPYSQKQWLRNLDRTVRANKLKEARIRMAVWKENGHRRIAIVSQAMDARWMAKSRRGLTAKISSVRRKLTGYTDIKSMDYGCFRRALNEARAERYDEAILLNHNGHLVEGSRTNVFYVRRGVLWTPSIKCGCLNGITRQIILRLARQHRIRAKTVEAGAHALKSSDEAFLTNSLIGVAPLLTIDQRTLANGRPGPMTRFCQKAYQTIVHSSCLASGEPL